MEFPKDFLWGAASAAHQVEGAYNEDGKTLGIWDALHEGHIKHSENGYEACDHYHRYKEDVALMKKIGLKSYRFSISWPRVMPEKGIINPQGLAFYSNLVDELVNAGIEPMVTLYHWNLPIWAYNEGGWENEALSDIFVDYVKVVVEKLSDRTKYWLTFNEPQCFIGFGYCYGTHAPFLKNSKLAGVLSRNVMLAHGKAVKAIRSYAKLKPIIGMAPTGGGLTPLTNDEKGLQKALEGTYTLEPGALSNTWWMDPIILGKIPEPLQKYISDEDIKVICQPLDFFGFNIYGSSNSAEQEGVKNPEVYPGMPRTSLNWAITPEVLYWLPKFHYERYHLPILITENGMANIDFEMLDGKVHDPQRIDYIHRHLLNLKRVMDEGVPVIGYQYWSLTDNFEWAEGYDQRFGLIYIDYRTQKRIMKDSAYYYADIIKTNGVNL